MSYESRSYRMPWGDKFTVGTRWTKRGVDVATLEHGEWCLVTPERRVHTDRDALREAIRSMGLDWWGYEELDGSYTEEEQLEEVVRKAWDWGGIRIA